MYVEGLAMFGRVTQAVQTVMMRLTQTCLLAYFRYFRLNAAATGQSRGQRW